MIELGDRIGDFMVTTCQLGNVTFLWQLEPTKEENHSKFLMNVDWGKNLNISVGIYDDTRSGKLDSK
jgi:hypothetical protein